MDRTNTSHQRIRAGQIAWPARFVAPIGVPRRLTLDAFPNRRDALAATDTHRGETVAAIDADHARAGLQPEAATGRAGRGGLCEGE